MYSVLLKNDHARTLIKQCSTLINFLIVWMFENMMRIILSAKAVISMGSRKDLEMRPHAFRMVQSIIIIYLQEKY